MSTKRDMDILLESFIKKQGGAKGCICMCAQHQKTTYEGCFGYADVEKQIPITPNTLFRLMSLTKVILCTAGMILYERGLFSLDDPVSDYIHEYANTRRYIKTADGHITVPLEEPIRIRHAFTMTCGYPYDVGGHEISQLMTDREEQLAKEVGWDYDIVAEARAIAEVPIAFEPGSHFLYGYGHDIISALIQVISGLPTSEFMRKEIFKPLGMNDTAYRYSGNHRERMATMYHVGANGTYTPGSGPRDRYHEPDAKYDMGGTGLYSSAVDYLVFTQMLANKGRAPDGTSIISQATIDLMRTNQLSEQALLDFRRDRAFCSYGYGYGVRTRMDGPGDNNAPVGEFGWAGYGGPWASIDPSSGFSCVFMQQVLPDQGGFCHPRVRAVVYGKQDF